MPHIPKVTLLFISHAAAPAHVLHVARKGSVSIGGQCPVTKFMPFLSSERSHILINLMEALTSRQSPENELMCRKTLHTSRRLFID